MDRLIRRTPTGTPPKLRIKEEPWPHPDNLAAFHDEIQRLWVEGLQNLLENTVPHQFSQYGKEG